MKALLALSALLISTLSYAHGWKSEARKILKEYRYACKSTEVVVDSIIRNGHIRGHIKGLPTEALSKFKVVFYVKTNRWYVHPYANGEEGHSYSNLTSHGRFKVKTVLRDVPAKKLAVVLVPQPYKIKEQHRWLKTFWGLFGGVLKYSCNHTLVDGNGDFFL